MNAPRPAGFLLALALTVVLSGCADDDEPEAATTTAAPVTTATPATTALPPPPPPPTTEAAAAQLSPCEQYFVALDALSAEFVELVDEGNRALLLTIGLETPYEEGADELAAVATRLREINAEIEALGEVPTELDTRVRFVIDAVDQFALGYEEASEAAALSDVVALNQSLNTVSQGTGLLRAASETPVQCL